MDNPLAVRRPAIGEAALDAAMAVIGFAILPWDHPDDFLAAHLRLETAADTAISASRDGRMFRLTDGDHRILRQRRGRAGLHAGAAGHAFGFEEGLTHSGRNPAVEAAPIDGQRESALRLLAGAHAAIADDAFGWIISKIGIGFVLRLPFSIGSAVVPGENMIGASRVVADLAQADCSRHILKFAISVGRAGEAIERMVGEIEPHHAATDRIETRRIGLYGNAWRDRRRT